MIHKLMLRVLLVTLFLSLYLCMAPPPAKAQAGGEGAAVAAVIFIVGAYVATMATICTPVAAIRASDHPRGFGGAFGECFDVTNWFASKPAQAEEQKEEDVVLSQSPVEESGVEIGAEGENAEYDATLQMEASAKGDIGEE